MIRRFIQSLAAFALLLGAPVIALAQGAAVQSIMLGERLEEKRDEYGARDLDRLETELQRSIETALSRSDLLAETITDADVLIEVTLLDAWPNRPTHAQLGARPGLSFESVSRGGARLTAVIYDAGGAEIDQVDYEWRTLDIADSARRSTWTDAERTFDRFADRLADRISKETRSAG